MDNRTEAGRKLCREKFVKIYGDLDELLTEDHWLALYGCWVISGDAAIQSMSGEGIKDMES